MRKNDNLNQIDELMLNVLGVEFFREKQIRVKIKPFTPKTVDLRKEL